MLRALFIDRLRLYRIGWVTVHGCLNRVGSSCYDQAETHENSRNFAVVGVGGHVAPRHLRAIREVGGRLMAAADPNDSVGILDQFSLDVRFFTEMERLDRHLEKLRRGPASERVHYLSICSPNYLHDAHCRLGLRLGADVICEKPLVINPWNLDVLERLEEETAHKVFTILQLRLHPRLVELRRDATDRREVDARCGPHVRDVARPVVRGLVESVDRKIGRYPHEHRGA